ncbi:hypothetical protein [Massilia sp. NR 4-1]|uniref:hypothetical protein n=1 Tax=Massilia sp. NR 4-1 TaxID=1678028 RepID=UPI00067DA55D|nr:hypothetical protein [Massilia sp. NR 4-1]AKU21896.1 hypothetical protein ACZ75_10870 [Massilia sp. NR 4-1]
MKKTPATSQRTNTKVAMSAVRIGFDSYLLPSDKALALLGLLQKAVRCQDSFGREQRYVTDNQPPELSLVVVPEKNIRHISTDDFDNHRFLIGS